MWFRGFCGLYGLSELPKYMVALTNDRINDSELVKKGEALFKKLGHGRWTAEKIKKVKESTIL
ncbi:MAG: hypothetical protein Q4D57_00155 [Clostridia bacterium]|nr:hypothetical protein [Clostridia bacterium]